MEFNLQENQNLVTMEENKETQIIDGQEYIINLTSAVMSYCSLQPKTEDEKITMFNAMNSPSKRLSEEIGEIIKVKDIYIEVVECRNTETGELTKQPRIVLIDETGEGHQCVSVGIYSALKKLLQVFGVPSWETPLPLKVKQIKIGSNKSLLTLDYVKVNKK